jgi:hypothetical protein
VKQQCGLNQFIEINDKLEMLDMVFISNNLCGERARQRRDRKRECERQSIAGNGR